MELPTGVIGSLDRITGASSFYRDRSNVVLMYHSIGGGGYGDIPPSRLAEHIQTLADAYEIVDLPEVLIDDGRKKVALTFDDGYRDFCANAVPVLRRFDVPATVFLIGDAFEGRELLRHCRYEPMTRKQISELADDDLVTIGNHTRRHVDLSKAEDDVLHEEIVGAKSYLEDEFGISVDRFCYPHNGYCEAADEIVREGHEYAVKVDGLFERITSNTDPFRIPRISGSYPTPWVTFAASDLARDTGLLTKIVVGDAFSRGQMIDGNGSSGRSLRERAFRRALSKMDRS